MLRGHRRMSLIANVAIQEESRPPIQIEDQRDHCLVPYCAAFRTTCRRPRQASISHVRAAEDEEPDDKRRGRDQGKNDKWAVHR